MVEFNLVLGRFERDHLILELFPRRKFMKTIFGFSVTGTEVKAKNVLLLANTVLINTRRQLDNFHLVF